MQLDQDIADAQAFNVTEMPEFFVNGKPLPSFGYEQLKTFFDLELAVHVAPFVTVGVRGGFGVQYDFLPVMGVYAQIGRIYEGTSNMQRITIAKQLLGKLG